MFRSIIAYCKQYLGNMNQKKSKKLEFYILIDFQLERWKHNKNQAGLFSNQYPPRHRRLLLQNKVSRQCICHMCRMLVVELYWICWLLLKSDAKEKSSIVHFHSSLFYEDNLQKLHFFLHQTLLLYIHYQMQNVSATIMWGNGLIIALFFIKCTNKSKRSYYIIIIHKLIKKGMICPNNVNNYCCVITVFSN